MTSKGEDSPGKTSGDCIQHKAPGLKVGSSSKDTEQDNRVDRQRLGDNRSLHSAPGGGVLEEIIQQSRNMEYDHGDQGGELQRSFSEERFKDPGGEENSGGDLLMVQRGGNFAVDWGEGKL